jgi:hypothetical protein
MSNENLAHPYVMGRGIPASENSYYGRLDPVENLRPFWKEVIKEEEIAMIEFLREMEERLKRHVTEAKREIIKELQKGNKEMAKKLLDTEN